jgi:hypothetical protein
MAASGLDLKRGRGGAIHRVTHEGQQRTPARLATLGLLTQATVPPVRSGLLPHFPRDGHHGYLRNGSKLEVAQ